MRFKVATLFSAGDTFQQEKCESERWRWARPDTFFEKLPRGQEEEEAFPLFHFKQKWRTSAYLPFSTLHVSHFKQQNFLRYDLATTKSYHMLTLSGYLLTFLKIATGPLLKVESMSSAADGTKLTRKEFIIARCDLMRPDPRIGTHTWSENIWLR